jgi:hypothetical protein
MTFVALDAIEVIEGEFYWDVWRIKGDWKRQAE